MAEDLKLTPVKSSNVKEVGHDPGTDTLYVRFNNGALYEYEGVSHELYHGLIQARSVGRYFHVHVRPHYEGQRVEDAKMREGADIKIVDDPAGMGPCPRCNLNLVADGHVEGAIEFRCGDCSYRVTAVTRAFAERVAALVTVKHEEAQAKETGPVRIVVPSNALASEG